MLRAGIKLLCSRQDYVMSQLAGLAELVCAQAEVERLIFEDSDPTNGFVLHPDMKWARVLFSVMLATNGLSSCCLAALPANT